VFFHILRIAISAQWAHHCTMSFFPHASSRRGASVLAALVFIALVGLIAGGLQTLAPKVALQESQSAQAAAPMPPTRPAGLGADTTPSDCKPGFVYKLVTVPKKPLEQQEVDCFAGAKLTSEYGTNVEDTPENRAANGSYNTSALSDSSCKGGDRASIIPSGSASGSVQPLHSNLCRVVECKVPGKPCEVVGTCNVQSGKMVGDDGKDTTRSCSELKDKLKSASKTGSGGASDAKAAERDKLTGEFKEKEKAIQAAQAAEKAAKEKADAARENFEMAQKAAQGCKPPLGLDYFSWEKCAVSREVYEATKSSRACSTSGGQYYCTKGSIDKLFDDSYAADTKAQGELQKAAGLTKELQGQMDGLKGKLAGLQPAGGNEFQNCAGSGFAGAGCGQQQKGGGDGPPGGGQPDGPPGGGGPPNTFGDPQGGGMGGGMGGAMGGIGGALARMFGGGQQRQQNPYGQNPYNNPYNQQMCQTSYQCQGNTLVYRTPQCQQQPLQYCQYGCDQTGTMCAQQPSPYGRGTDGQPCPQPPQKPDNGECSAGVWQSLSATNNGCVTGWKCSVTGSPTAPKAEITCTPQVADVGATVSIEYSCSAGTVTATGFTVASSTLSGTASAVVPAPAQGSNLATFGITCAKDGLTAGAQCNVQVARPSIVLVANPKKVKAGESATVGWVTAGMRSCVVSSPDSAAFTDANKNNTSINGVAQTPAINSPMTIRITCETLGGATKAAETRIEVE
jgi:hypothetical protein